MEPRRDSTISPDAGLCVVRYREYAPCAALSPFVRAFFSFAAPRENETPTAGVVREVCFRAGDSFCSPLFADGHVSIVFSFPRACRAGGVWEPHESDPRGDVIGPMTRVGPASLSERQEMMGAYLRVGSARAVASVPAKELTDRVVSLEDLWGVSSVESSDRLNRLAPEGERVAALESILLQRMVQMRRTAPGVDIEALGRWIVQTSGRIRVDALAASAGVSRQHLTRIFRESVGVTPKRYCRLARFQGSLPYTADPKVDWAQTALEMGYADQSHMIAEFRCFSSLTPEQLARERWFHPFIGRPRMPRQPQPAERFAPAQDPQRVNSAMRHS